VCHIGGTRVGVRPTLCLTSSDLVCRQFTTPKPDQPGVADIMYVRTGSGELYLAVVLDTFNTDRCPVGERDVGG
jgi:transposase InsO family protein